MTDSRAALEERARQCFFHDDIPETQRVETTIEALADFAEQESSSLKLLLRAMCRGDALASGDLAELKLCVRTHLRKPSGIAFKTFPVELDSSGIPVLTEEILKALEAAK